ncbi:hypothetical protein LBMAG42_03850 [Deltaproteobacteria bacterium]|nr:hypothetical protein LBMAG42_03850 [Deltaproteobacteria bacterium]
MIRINLLPVRQTRKAESLRREAVLAGLFGAIILGGCLFVWAGLGIRLSSVNAENVKLDAEIAKLAEDVKRVDDAEAAKADLERKLDVIGALRAKKTGPAHMLDELALAAPEKLQLSAVTEHQGAMQITGLAVSNEVISQFLRSLEASDYFEQVYLQNIEAVDLKQSSSTVVLKKFSLTAKRTSLAPAKSKKDAKDDEKSAPAAPEAPAAGAAPSAAGAPAPAAAAPAADGTAPAAPAAAAPAPATPAAPAAGGTP